MRASTSITHGVFLQIPLGIQSLTAKTNGVGLSSSLSVHSLGLRQTLAEVRKHLDPNATEFITKGKYKYIYPLKPEMIDLCKKLHKPYPKKPTAHI